MKVIVTKNISTGFDRIVFVFTPVEQDNYFLDLITTIDDDHYRHFVVYVNDGDIDESLDELADKISNLARPIITDKNVEARRIELEFCSVGNGSYGLQTYIQNVVFKFSEARDRMAITFDCIR